MKKNNSRFNIQDSTLITDIPCVILSGGKSSRMGEDKSLLPFKNCDTLIEYQYKKLSKLFKKVYISSKTDKFDFIDKSKIIIDKNQNISSPMIALKSVFEKLQTKKLFIITVDVPLIHTDTIKELIAKSNNYDVIIASDINRDHNLCGVFNISLLPLINELLIEDIHKINYLIKKSKNFLKLKFLDKEQFINLNTNDDYKKALGYKL